MNSTVNSLNTDGWRSPSHEYPTLPLQVRNHADSGPVEEFSERQAERLDDELLVAAIEIEQARADDGEQQQQIEEKAQHASIMPQTAAIPCRPFRRWKVAISSAPVPSAASALPARV